MMAVEAPGILGFVLGPHSHCRPEAEALTRHEGLHGPGLRTASDLWAKTGGRQGTVLVARFF